MYENSQRRADDDSRAGALANTGRTFPRLEVLIEANPLFLESAPRAKCPERGFRKRWVGGGELGLDLAGALPDLVLEGCNLDGNLDCGARLHDGTEVIERIQPGTDAVRCPFVLDETVGQ